VTEGATPAIRVLLSQMPQILHDILEHAVRRQPDLELIHDGVAPDVVILGATSLDLVRMPLAVLEKWPATRVMIVTPGEGDAALFELRPHVTALGRVSPSDLIQRIRQSVRPQPG
jgi:hypothetical protein